MSPDTVLGADSRFGRPLLLIAVAIAFADSSIVVLAVPDIQQRFAIGITAASWVITAYNVAVVAACVLALALLHRTPSRALAISGLSEFALASLGAAVAPSLSVLVAFRALQGVGAAFVLVTALAFLARGGAARLWTFAATIGLAAGPALGGILTEFFSWRSIFIAQAPLVALALIVIATSAPIAVATSEAADRRAYFANAALAALSAALVGALFLVVVLLINGFGWRPLPAALVATTLPAAALASHTLARRAPALAAAAGGSALIATGLAVLGLVPGDDLWLIVAGLAFCGFGLGLAADPLGGRALAVADPAAAARTVLFRHVGLVAALLIVTPLLVSSLGELEAKADAVAGEIVLDAPLPLTTKVPLALELARAADNSDGTIPDIDALLGGYEGRDRAEVHAVAGRLDASLRELVARAFRSSFLACAAFALIAALIGLIARERMPKAAQRLRLTAAATVAAAAAATGALATEVRLGALHDPAAMAVPCHRHATFAGASVDARLQRLALVALDTAACRLGTSTGTLLRSLLGAMPVPWDDERLERALKAGLVTAVEEERARSGVAATAATVLELVAAAAPVRWIRELLAVLGRGS